MQEKCSEKKQKICFSECRPLNLWDPVLPKSLNTPKSDRVISVHFTLFLVYYQIYSTFDEYEQRERQFSCNLRLHAHEAALCSK